MKKMIMFAAIAVAAMFAQGASVYWTCTNVYAGDSTTKNAGIAYFVTTATLADASSLTGKSAAEITAALGSSYSYKPTTAGTYSVTSANAVENSALGLEDGTDYSAYLVIFNGDTIASSTSFFTTPVKSFTSFEGANSTSIAFGTQKTASQAAWSGSIGGGDSGTPEPTSGLLLLVGGAMLALRRKQK